MSKRQRRKQAGKDGPFLFRDPLDNIPRDVLRTALVKRGHEAAESLPILKRELIELVKECDPHYFLSNIAQSALVSGVDDSGNLIRPTKKTLEKKLEQFHVELAQAVYLTIPADQILFDPAHPRTVQNICEKLIEIAEAFHEARYARIKGTETEVQEQLIGLQERIRLHTQVMRNWGYYRQVVEILRRLYAPLDDHFERLVGLKATELIVVFDRMIQSIEKKSSKFREKLTAAVSQKTKAHLIEEYFRQFEIPDQGKISEFVKFSKEQELSRKNIIVLLISHSGLHLADVYRFEAEEIAEWIGRDARIVKASLGNFSLSYGDLSEFEFDHLFLGNPVWEKPLVLDRNGNFRCYMPQLFFGFSFHILDSILANIPVANAALARRRAQFLEAEIEIAFSGAFGTQFARRNVKWQYDGVQFETDLLIQFDSQLFIVEAKSNRISWPALRGAPDRMARHIQELLIDPAIQSKRLEDAIWEWKNGDRTKLEIDDEIDLTRVKTINRFSITLEDFSTIQSNLKELGSAGTLDPKYPIAVTLTLADLESVFEILDNAVERLYYLERRKEIQDAVLYVADEMDILGIYVQNGLELGEIEEGNTSVIALGMSKKIDEYFQARELGFEPDKPRRPMTKWFADIVARLSTRKPQRWTEAAVMLMRLSYEDQQEVFRRFEKVRRSLEKDAAGTDDEIDTVVVTPPAWRSTGFACVAFREGHRGDRHAIMERGASSVFQSSNAKRCLVIANDVKGATYPYATLGVFERPANAAI